MVPCPWVSWLSCPCSLGCPGHGPRMSWLSRPCSWVVLVTLPRCPGHVPGVPRPPTLLTKLTLAFPDSRRTGWSSTPCGMSEATAAPSAAAPTATAGGSASPSWATTPTPTATRAGGSSAGSSCPATGGSRGCWAGCSPRRAAPGAWVLSRARLARRHPSG